MKSFLQIIVVVIFIGGCKSIRPVAESSSQKKLESEPDLSRFFNPILKPFYHGVASGDPLFNAVVIWSKLTPGTETTNATIIWQMSLDSTFKSIVKSGVSLTDKTKDFTIKEDVKGLEPDTYYYYRFIFKSDTSMVGRTRTAPIDSETLKFAVASCSNYQWGYFNAYGRMAEEQDLNAIIHLGDYIYEHGVGGYGDTTIGRKHEPKHEIVSLKDYRTRYAQYRLDIDLLEAHQNHPFIAIWDDHEITNDAYIDGAENHQADEGDYNNRKKIAKQVYYEWMPIRESNTHYRKFSFGPLADLVMLDERLEGRTKQADSLDDPRRLQDNHSLLGASQFNWLENTLIKSKAQWKLLGNQVIFSRQDWGKPTFRLNMDSWDGYPADQKRLSNFLKNNNIENTIILTGDTHSSWAFEATDDPFNSYNSTTSQGAVAVEFGVTSINSANPNEYQADNLVMLDEIKLLSKEVNPHLKYVNRRDHGYLLIELSPSQLLADFKIVPSVRYRTPEVSSEKRFKVLKNSYKLEDFKN